MDEDMPPARRRELLARTLLRPALSATAMVAVYYLLPLDGAGGTALAFFLLGLVVLAGTLVLQVRAVSTSPHPRLRALEALITVVPFFVLLFAAVFVVMARLEPAAFTEPLTRTDALYFTLSVVSTVGFGDISPASQAARAMVTVQITVNLVLVGVVARVLVTAVQAGLNRRPDSPQPPEPPG